MTPSPRLLRRARAALRSRAATANNRILFFDDRHHTMRGGQAVLVDLVAYARDLGFEPHVATFGRGPLWDAAQQSGAIMHQWPVPDDLSLYDGHFRHASRPELIKAAWSSIRLGLDLYRRVRTINPGAVYLSALRPSLFLWPLLFDSRPSLWYAQGNANLGWLSRGASLIPTRLATLSTASRACFGVDDVTQLEVPTIAIGVDTSTIQPSQRQPFDQTVSRPLRVLCVGEITPAKGQARLAAACEHLHHRTGADIELSLVGGVRSEIGERYLQRVLNAAPSVKVADRGWLGDLSEIYSQHDLVALTSEAEGTPRVFVEAWAAGIPVVSTDVGGIKEVYGGRHGMYLVDSDAEETDVSEALWTAAHGVDRPALQAQAAEFGPEPMLGQLLELLTAPSAVEPTRWSRLRAHYLDGIKQRKGHRE